MIINREVKGIMREFWKNAFRVVAGLLVEPERTGLQYARDYLELYDLFERNGIDVWQIRRAVIGEIERAGIESPANQDHGVYPWKLIDALRIADAASLDRAKAVAKLEEDRRELYLTSGN